MKSTTKNIRFNRLTHKNKKGIVYERDHTGKLHPPGQRRVASPYAAAPSSVRFFNNEVTYIIVAHGRAMTSYDTSYNKEIYSNVMLPLEAFSFGALVEDNCILVGKNTETMQESAARMLKNTIERKHLIFSRCKMLNKKTNEYWFPNMLFNGGGSDFISTICRMDERNNVTYFPLTSDTDLQTILIDILIREQRFTWDTTSVLPKQVRVNPKINVIFNTCMAYFDEVIDTKKKSAAFNCFGKDYAAGIVCSLLC